MTLLSDLVYNLLGALADFPIFSILNEFGGLPVFGQQFREILYLRRRTIPTPVFGDATFKVTDGTQPDRRHPLHARSQALHLAQRRLHRRRAGDDHGAGRALQCDPRRARLPGRGAGQRGGLLPRDGGQRGADLRRGRAGGQVFTRTETFNDVSPRFVVQYDVDPDVHLFASASRGYKAGGFNSVQINSFFAPENVWNFEGGVKSELSIAGSGSTPRAIISNTRTAS
ncbi:TonB-dependent receptor domain-containing protein [Sphingomonas sp. MMS24-JH45]